MVKVRYKARLFSDQYFILWLKENENVDLTLSHLTFIKASSKLYRKEHNVLFHVDAKKLIDSGIVNQNKLEASFKCVTIPNFLVDEDEELSRNVRYAIFLSSDTARGNYESVILTSPEKKEEYLKNKHYNTIKSVTIKDGEDAVELIKSYFKEFERERQTER
jgi:hypothetical protein